MCKVSAYTVDEAVEWGVRLRCEVAFFWGFPLELNVLKVFLFVLVMNLL